MYADANIKISCQKCSNVRFFKKYQKIDVLRCPECGYYVEIYNMDVGLRVLR